MADQPPDLSTGAGDEPGIPRWVKVFGMIALLVVLMIGVIVFTGLGGPHGPQRHGPALEHQASLIG